jgi:hypothetical protein
MHIPVCCCAQFKWLAFEDIVDWDSIAIIVHRSEMASIPERVNATDVAAKRADVGCGTARLWHLVILAPHSLSHVASLACGGTE